MMGGQEISSKTVPAPPPPRKRLVVYKTGDGAQQRRRAPMTFDEAAEALGLDKVSTSPQRMVASLCRRGRLRPIKIGRFVLIDADSVDALLDAR